MDTVLSKAQSKLQYIYTGSLVCLADTTGHFTQHTAWHKIVHRAFLFQFAY